MTALSTPADLLREAARLMRAHAEAAMAGPYEVTGDAYKDEPVTLGVRDDLMGFLAEFAPFHRDTAEHLAHWPPAVAIEVAKLLDAEATWAQDHPPTPEGYGYPEDSKCLRIARAYLGGVNP